MKSLLKFILLAVLAAAVAGCCHCRAIQKKSRRPLEGTRWQLVQLGGRSMQPEADSFCFTLSPEQHRLTGRGACNRLMGEYRTDGKRSLRISSIASTRMGCPDLETEQAFIAALESATHYDMDGPMLLLLSDKSLKAVFQAAPEEQ